MIDQYIPTDRFDTLVAALVSLDRDHPEFENNVITTLGEVGGLWPDTLKAELEAYEAGFEAAQTGIPAVSKDTNFLRGYADGAFDLARSKAA
ncbi:hypothetical protein [Cypionkella sp.]|uniref:hypothetical protein n=1 Tax=Cypionkella sp. TaxID=2811411 RepID=UPI00272649F7|nr:hypothetical protein [Cypionkella sp.]MDO8985561.1 hypothetical protein [Cypionkella sp.]MDP2048774.1 hypothetical protein [Cypionkella sp.]